MQRGERVAVIGPNGAGKTTLLRLVAGELAPDGGEVKLGHSVLAGYYAQHHFDKAQREGEPQLRTSGTGTLDPDRTILDTLWDLVPDRGEAYVRSVAGSFLFSGDDVEKRVGVLSGGERARVALAKLLLVPANLLIMDEPTNHLDLDSAEALIEALQAYRGTLLFVSHNRSFLNGLATVIWEVKDGGIIACPGNLDDWLYHQQQLEAAAVQAEEAAPGARGAAGGGEAPRGAERRRLEAEARNARSRRERPLREEITALEERIAWLEAEDKETTAVLADPALYQEFARAQALHRAAGRGPRRAGRAAAPAGRRPRRGWRSCGGRSSSAWPEPRLHRRSTVSSTSWSFRQRVVRCTGAPGPFRSSTTTGAPGSQAIEAVSGVSPSSSPSTRTLAPARPALDRHPEPLEPAHPLPRGVLHGVLPGDDGGALPALPGVGQPPLGPARLRELLLGGRLLARRRGWRLGWAEGAEQPGGGQRQQHQRRQEQRGADGDPARGGLGVRRRHGRASLADRRGRIEVDRGTSARAAYFTALSAAS